MDSKSAGSSENDLPEVVLSWVFTLQNNHFSYIIAFQSDLMARMGTTCDVMHAACSNTNKTLAATIFEDKKQGLH